MLALVVSLFLVAPAMAQEPNVLPQVSPGDRVELEEGLSFVLPEGWLLMPDTFNRMQESKLDAATRSQMRIVATLVDTMTWSNIQFRISKMVRLGKDGLRALANRPLSDDVADQARERTGHASASAEYGAYDDELDGLWGRSLVTEPGGQRIGTVSLTRPIANGSLYINYHFEPENDDEASARRFMEAFLRNVELESAIDYDEAQTIRDIALTIRTLILLGLGWLGFAGMQRWRTRRKAGVAQASEA